MPLLERYRTMMTETTVEVGIGTQPFDLAFHPTADLVAVAAITGHVQLHKYGNPGSGEAAVAQLWTSNAHSESCRAIRFVQGGEVVLTASADKSILATNVETGQAMVRLADAHGEAINRLVNCSENIVASGDDGGTVKVWDTRQNKGCNSFSAHEDFVADMEFLPGSHQILAASGDGSLSICNLRRNRIDLKTEFAEDELLSVVVCKNGQKVICGSQDGVLLLYSWGAMADCSDRFLGHPNSVDAMLKMDEDTLLTGSSDGIIRIVTILPNKMIGVIGEHADFPVERLAFSRDRNILGSASHDNTVKLWDVRYLLEDDMEGEEDESAAVQPMSVADSDDSDGQMEVEESKQRKKRGEKGKHCGGDSSSSFFDDL